MIDQGHRKDAVVYKGSHIQVVERPFALNDGGTGLYEVVERIGAKGIVCIFALTPEGNVLINRINRPPCRENGAGGDIFELPVGLVEDGENPEDAARRELLEETGHYAGELLFIFSGPFNAGLSGAEMSFYFAPYAVLQKAPQHEDGERITAILRVPLEALATFVSISRETFGVPCDAKILSILPILQQKGFV